MGTRHLYWILTGPSFAVYNWWLLYGTYQENGIAVYAPEDEGGEECAQVLTRPVHRQEDGAQPPHSSQAQGHRRVQVAAADTREKHAEFYILVLCVFSRKSVRSAQEVN
jgi:hypothetical protein